MMRMQPTRHGIQGRASCLHLQPQPVQVPLCCLTAHAPTKLQSRSQASSLCMAPSCSPSIIPGLQTRQPLSLCRQSQGFQRSRSLVLHVCHASQQGPESAQQPSKGTTDAAQEPQAVQQEAGSIADVVEPTVMEPDYEMLSEADQRLIAVLPLVPMTVAQQAASIHVSLFYMFVLQAVGLSYAAIFHPSALLVADAAGPLGSTLLGCAAAASLQAAGLCMHLRGTFGELCTWRAQRVNAAVLLFSLICGISALASVTASQPLLTVVLLFTGLLGTLGCGHVARSCWPHGPWLQWVVIPDDMRTTWDTILMYLQRDLGSVAGTLCLVWLAVGVCGAAGVLLSGASWGGCTAAAISVQGHYINHLWYPYATSQKAAATLDVLRRVCGAGLILGATMAHTLLEAAFYMRALPLMSWLKVNLLNIIRGDDRLVDLFRPPEHRFNLLTVLGVVAAAALQSVFLLRAPDLGVNLNADVALMAPLHWSTMIAVLYSCIALLRVDWNSVMGVVQRSFDFFVGILSVMFQTVVLKLEWMRPHKL